MKIEEYVLHYWRAAQIRASISLEAHQVPPAVQTSKLMIVLQLLLAQPCLRLGSGHSSDTRGMPGGMQMQQVALKRS